MTARRVYQFGGRPDWAALVLGPPGLLPHPAAPVFARRDPARITEGATR
jgi:hypothetical protein